MSDIYAILSGATCGLNCWLAEEPICRCYCAGANHGLMLKAGAIQPKRMAKLDGIMYELIGISAYKTNAEYKALYTKANKINSLPENEFITHDNFYKTDRINYPEYNSKNAPIRIKKATQSQVNNWSEVKSISELNKTIHVYLLWQKIGYITELNKAIVDAIINNDEIKYYTELKTMLINKHAELGLKKYQERLIKDRDSFKWYINFNKEYNYPEYQGINKEVYEWLLIQTELIKV